MLMYNQQYIPSLSVIEMSVEVMSSCTASSPDDITKMNDSFSSLSSSSTIGTLVHSRAPELEFALNVRDPSILI